MTLHVGRAFQRSVTVSPDRTAAVDPDAGARYTYREWDERIRSVVTGLRELGVEPGDRVGIAAQSRIELATVFWATQYLSATFVPYNIRAAADELAFLVNNTSPEVLFFSAVTADATGGARSDLEATDTFVALDEAPSYAEAYDSLVGSEPSSIDPPSVDPGDTSVILHTSGTTGRPKAVPRSHEATYTSSHSHAIQVRWEEGETCLGLMPVFHTMGLHTLTTIGLLNGTWVAQRSFSPEQTLELIEDESISSLYLVPTVFHDIVHYDDRDEFDISSVHKLAYAGIPMTEALHETLVDVFDPDAFVNHYGSTEVFTYSTCPNVADKPGCAGRFGMNPEIRIVTPKEGETVPPTDTVPDGETGEIIINTDSPEIFDGYLNRPEANEQSFEDGWYFTGDLGYIDDEDDLWIAGRVDDMIISGGENVYPVEVENVLADHERVTELAVVGHEDERWNEVITAYVAVPEDSSAEDFGSWASDMDQYLQETDRLANFKRPRRYVFVDELVKSEVGKVLRQELAEADADVKIYADVRV